MHITMAWRSRAAARVCSRRTALRTTSSSIRAHCFHSQQLVSDALREAREQLQRITTTTSAIAAAAAANTCAIDARDAKPLIAYALEPPLYSSHDVFLHLDRQLTHTEARTLTDALARRCRGEPLAYITGSREFWSLAFAVTPSTLIPRSDSEVLIETLVELYPKHSDLRILDIGTGSGCLLVSALSEFPCATGVAIDVSLDALAVAEQNARTHGVSHRATFLQQDLRDLPSLQPTSVDSTALYQQFDVVLSNPPYIPRGELHLVAPDVLAHEPHLALFSDGPTAIAATMRSSDCDSNCDGDHGSDDPQGLRMYRYLQQSVERLLAPRNSSRSHARSVVLEVGSEMQAHAVRELFTSSPSSPSSPPVAAGLCFERFLVDARQRHRGLLLQQQNI